MKTTLTIVLALLSLFCRAQGDPFSVSGTVVDSDDQPIPFATVFILNTPIGTSTDENGYFRLRRIPKGNHRLVVSSVGFIGAQTEISLFGTPVRGLKLQLKEEKVDLDEITVSGERKATQINRSGFAVTSVDMKLIETRSLELTDVLEQTPGLKVRRDGGLGSATTFNLNGMSGNAVRIFIDGVPMESFGSSYSVNSIPVSLIERVDVYKGVVPVELGNDAMGGAINIVTKQFSNTGKPNQLDGTASYQFGSFNTHRTDLNVNWRNNKTGITGRVSGFYNYSDNRYQVWSDDIKIRDYEEFLADGTRNPNYLKIIAQGVKVRRFNDAYHSKGVKADFGITAKSWADQLFFGLNLSDDYKELQHGPRMITPYGERFSESRTFAQSLKYLKSHFLISNLTVSADAQYSETKRSVVDTTVNKYDWYGKLIPRVAGVTPVAGEAGTATLNIDDNRNYVGRVSAQYRIGEHHQLGVNYSYNRFMRSSDDAMQAAELRNYGSTNTVTKQITGVTYQQELFDEKVRNSVFAKYYHNRLEQYRIEKSGNTLDTLNFSRPDANWGYGATTSFAPSKRVRINASAEQAVRLVNTNEVFGNVSDEIVASTDLKPEKSLNINLGGQFTLFESSVAGLNLTTNLFVRDTYDRIRRSVVVSGDDSYSVFGNIGHVQSKGIEAQADYRLGKKWHFMLQGYYLDSRFLERYSANGSLNLNYKSREPNMPYLTGSGSVGYTHGRLLQRDDLLSLTWYSSYIHAFHFDWSVIGNQNKPVIPAQFINDVSASYRFANQRTTIAVDGRNIFNTLAFDNFAVQRPGASVAVKLSYRF